MIRLAEHLHKHIHEVEALPSHEIDAWAGYLVIKEAEHAKAEAEAKAKARAPGRRGIGPSFGGGW